MAANESEEDRLIRQQVVNYKLYIYIYIYHLFSVTLRDLKLLCIMPLVELVKM